jgi:putative spermidine/putrescine transport system permease protein
MENRSLSRPLSAPLPQPEPSALPWQLWLERFQVGLMLAPALTVIGLLFMGGLVLALVQSLGYLPLIGRTEFSLQAYRQVLGQEAFYRSLWLTGWIALASTALSTGLAIVAALTLRRIARGQRWLSFIFQLNIPIPHLVGAIGILFLFSQSGWLARLAYLARLINEPADFPALVYDPYAVGIILEYVWKETCFIGVILLAVLQSLGEDYEDVARTLGANRWQRFRYVLLPLLRRAILSTSVLVFAFSFGAFEAPLLLGQRYPSALPVLAYRYYTDADLNARAEAMALNVIITVLITALVFLYLKLAGRET